MGIGPWASRGRKRTWQARFCVAIAGFRMGVPPIRRDPAGAGPGIGAVPQACWFTLLHLDGS